MIVYVDSKTKKVDLTKEQLESLLKEEYDRGYKDGEKTNPPITYTYSCPYGYWYCPYRGNTTTTTPTITWTSSNGTDTNGTIFCGDVTNSTEGTITFNNSNTVKE